MSLTIHWHFHPCNLVCKVIDLEPPSCWHQIITSIQILSTLGQQLWGVLGGDWDTCQSSTTPTFPISLWHHRVACLDYPGLALASHKGWASWDQDKDLCGVQLVFLLFCLYLIWSVAMCALIDCGVCLVQLFLVKIYYIWSWRPVMIHV